MVSDSFQFFEIMDKPIFSEGSLSESFWYDGIKSKLPCLESYAGLRINLIPLRYNIPWWSYPAGITLIESLNSKVSTLDIKIKHSILTISAQ